MILGKCQTILIALARPICPRSELVTDLRDALAASTEES